MDHLDQMLSRIQERLWKSADELIEYDSLTICLGHFARVLFRPVCAEVRELELPFRRRFHPIAEDHDRFRADIVVAPNHVSVVKDVPEPHTLELNG